MAFIPQLALLGALVGGLYALIGLSFVIIYKSTQVFSLAQGGLTMMGAYFFWQCLSEWSWPLWLGLVMTILFAAALGWIIQYLVIRPLGGQPVLSIILATMGLGVILDTITQAIWGAEAKIPPTIFPQGAIDVGGLYIGYVYFWAFGMSILAIVAFYLFYKYSDLGLAMRGTAESHTLAQSVGIETRTIFGLAWIIATIIAALCGILIANIETTNLTLSTAIFKALPVIILGGLESVLGVVVAGICIGIFEYVSAGLIDPIVGGGFRMIAPYIAMIPILIVRPFGFFGQKIIERV